MAKLSQADLMTQFKEMSLVELSEFVKAFETEFDVTAAAPVAAAGGAAAAGGGRREAEAGADVCDRRREEPRSDALHPPALDPPGRWPADPPQPQSARQHAKAGAAEKQPPGCLRRDRGWIDALGGDEQEPEGLRPPLHQHDPGR